jgi:hypothetical protein
MTDEKPIPDLEVKEAIDLLGLSGTSGLGLFGLIAHDVRQRRLSDFAREV